MPEIETRDWRQMSDLKDLPRLLSGGLQGLVSRDQLAQASALLDLAIQRYPDYAFVHAWRGKVYEMKGEADKARRAYEYGIERSSSRQSLCGGLAILEFNQNALWNAVRWWTRSAVIQLRTGSFQDPISFLYLSRVAAAKEDSSSAFKLRAASAAGVHGAIELNETTEAKIAILIGGDDTELIGAAIRCLTTQFWKGPLLSKINVEKAGLEQYRWGDEAQALSKACWEGDHQTVESLLKAGVSPNQPDRYGAIPIISASSKGHGKVVQILIAAGADVNAHEDALGHRFTAIGQAKALKQPHVVDILRAAGAIE